MPDAAYRVARAVARELAREQQLSPPFDLDALVERHAVLVQDEVPAHADVIALHAAAPGERPRIVVDASLNSMPERRRFAVAHALGHVLLGWHPLGAPCDVSGAPRELPVTVHDLVEGEAHAFARELLVPATWIAGFDAFDRPAELMQHVAARAGVPLMPAARAVGLQLPPGHVWVVADRWGRVIDAGRSPGTSACAPGAGAEFDHARHARHAVERHRIDLDGRTLWVWRFDAAGEAAVPHDSTARDVAARIGGDLGFEADEVDQLVARVDGVAGWANEQLGTASLEGMSRVLDQRVRALPELAQVAAHPAFGELVAAKATELVARRLAR